MDRSEIVVEFIQNQSVPRNLGENLFRLTDKSYSTNSPWSVNQFMDLTFQRNIHCLVVYYKAQLIGYAVLSVLPPEAELYLIVVDENFKQQGIASLMIDRINSYLEYEKVDSLFLEVRKSNNAAISFYKKNDFKKIDERKQYYSHPKEDAWIMIKKIE